jgi:hypothetical protein
LDVQKIKLSRYLFVSERFTECAVNTAKAAKRLVIAKQVNDTWMLLPRRGNHHEQLPARPQVRQTRFEVKTECIQLRSRQKSVLERRLAEAAQQRTPVVVRAEQMIGRRIFVVLPSVIGT